MPLDYWVDFICETLYFSIQALALEYPRMVSHRSTTILNNVLLDSSSQLELSMDQQNRTSSLFFTLGAISLMKLTGLPGPCKWLRTSSSIARKSSKVWLLTKVRPPQSTHFIQLVESDCTESSDSSMSPIQFSSSIFFFLHFSNFLLNVRGTYPAEYRSR